MIRLLTFGVENPVILALKHVSRVLGHCNNPALFVSHFQASTEQEEMPRTQTGQKGSVLGCCNVRAFCWHALERGYLGKPHPLIDLPVHSASSAAAEARWGRRARGRGSARAARPWWRWSRGSAWVTFYSPIYPCMIMSPHFQPNLCLWPCMRSKVCIKSPVGGCLILAHHILPQWRSAPLQTTSLNV